MFTPQYLCKEKSCPDGGGSKFLKLIKFMVDFFRTILLVFAPICLHVAKIICIFVAVFRMPMRNRVEMRHEALLSRHVLTKENNVKITDFLGGSNFFATLSQALANSTFLDTRAHTRQDKASFAFLQGKPSCFYAYSVIT